MLTQGSYYAFEISAEVIMRSYYAEIEVIMHNDKWLLCNIRRLLCKHKTVIMQHHTGYSQLP